MHQFTYENISSKLVEFFPELQESYNEYLEWWDGEIPGPHNMYGDILNPYLVDLIKKTEKEKISAIFDFVELLANQQDVRIQEVVTVTILERLLNEHLLEVSKPYMHTTTLKFSQELEGFWDKLRKAKSK